MPATDEEGRVKAIEAVARAAYDERAPRAAPPFEEAPHMLRHAFLTGAAEMVSLVYKIATPTSPDLEVFKMRVELLLQEVGDLKKVDGPALRRQLEALTEGL